MGLRTAPYRRQAVAGPQRAAANGLGQRIRQLQVTVSGVSSSRVTVSLEAMGTVYILHNCNHDNIRFVVLSPSHRSDYADLS